MSAEEKTLRIVCAINGAVQEVIFTGEKISYRMDEPEYPGCIKVYQGARTVIVPLTSLLLIDMNL
jgi:hypothetical protein